MERNYRFYRNDVSRRWIGMKLCSLFVNYLNLTFMRVYECVHVCVLCVNACVKFENF